MANSSTCVYTTCSSLSWVVKSPLPKLFITQCYFCHLEIKGLISIHILHRYHPISLFPLTWNLFKELTVAPISTHPPFSFKPEQMVTRLVSFHPTHSWGVVNTRMSGDLGSPHLVNKTGAMDVPWDCDVCNSSQCIRARSILRTFWWSSGYESALRCRRHGFNPWPEN